MSRDSPSLTRSQELVSSARSSLIGHRCEAVLERVHRLSVRFELSQNPLSPVRRIFSKKDATWELLLLAFDRYPHQGAKVRAVRPSPYWLAEPPNSPVRAIFTLYQPNEVTFVTLSVIQSSAEVGHEFEVPIRPKVN